MRARQKLTRNATTLAALVCVLGFQNCSPSNFSGAASTQANATASGTTSSSSSSSGTILGTLSLSDVSKIILNANVSTSLLGSYVFNSTLTLDQSASTYNAAMTLTGPTSAITLAQCLSSGTSVDFSALETALTQVTFATTQATSSSIPDFGAMTLEFVLNDGSTKTFTVNNDTQSAAVSGLTAINAVAVVEDLIAVAHHSACAGALIF